MERSTVERSLEASARDGAFYAVMVGLGESWVGLAAIFLGAGAAEVGLLSTIPLFVGACAQILSLAYLDRTRRRRRAFVGGAIVQTLAWIPMIGALFAPRPEGFWLLFLGFVLYFASVHFAVPAWTSVMGDLVPARLRGQYFGRRNSRAILLQTLALVLGGVGLWVYERAGDELWGYGVVFSGALAARVLSTVQLSRMAEPSYEPREEDRFTFRQFLRRIPASNFAKFALFVACLNAAAHFVGSLFVPYWRNDLGFGYWEMILVLAAILVVQVPALVFWGRVADRYGNKKVLAATSVGIAAIPMMWLISTGPAFACFMQFWSGFWWSGFNQSVGNFLLDAVSPPKRARCTAYLNLLANLGVLLGGVAGAWAIREVEPRLGPLELPYPFWTLLVLSTALRVSVVFIFLPLIREVRDVPKIGVTQMLFHASREAAEAALNVMTGWVPRPARDENGPRGSGGTGGGLDGGGEA